MDRLVALLGLFCFLLLAWLLSTNKRKIPWRVIGGGIFQQFAFALLVLKTDPGIAFFKIVEKVFMTVADCTEAGTEMVLGKLWFSQEFAQKSFVVKALPTIIFFSALISVLYYYGIMQWIIKVVAWVMRFTLGTSGAETLSAAANIFAGQTEAPLLIRPYLPRLTQSELMAVMVGGFANIAGSVMAVFAQMGISPSHLMTASVISAPGSLMIAKIMQPEIGQPETTGAMKIEFPKDTVNVIHAAANGTVDGVKLAINVLAMLIAFLALIKLVDVGVAFTGSQLGELFGQKWQWSLETGFGYAFAPLAWLMGVESKDCLEVGQLLGLKTVANEFVAYEKLQTWLELKPVPISERSVVLATYALCGFSNFASIGIQIGGLGPLAPERRGDLARLGLRAMIGGTLTNCMMACVVGIMI